METKTLAILKTVTMLAEGIDFGTVQPDLRHGFPSNTSGGKLKYAGPTEYTNSGNNFRSRYRDWNDYIDISAEVSGLTGKHDLYLYFSGGGDYLFNIDSFRFTGGTVPTPTPAGKIGDLNGMTV